MKVKFYDVNDRLPGIDPGFVGMSIDCVVLLDGGSLACGYYSHPDEHWLGDGIVGEVIGWRECA